MNKKSRIKLLSLLTLTGVGGLTFGVLAMGSHYFSADPAKPISPSIGSKQNAVYDEDNHTVDTIAYLPDNRGQVNVRFENVTLEDENIRVAGNDFFICFNKADSPIQGISDLCCSWINDAHATDSIGFALYFSYNPLNLNDIIGGKFQDLQSYIGRTNFDGTSFNLSIADAGIYAPEARYFLTIMGTPASPVTINNFSVDAFCTGEPDPQDIGTYSGYKTGEASAMVGFTDGFPFVGNGSYRFNDPEMFITLEPAGYYTVFKNYFEAQGFSYSTEYMGFEVYQKPYNSTLYYTYGFLKAELANMDMIQVFYGGLSPYMATETSWPEDTINSVLQDATFKSQIYDPEFEGDVSYVCEAQVTSSSRAVGVVVTTDGEHYNNNITIIKSYRDAFVDYGFMIQGENESPAYYSVNLVNADFSKSISLDCGTDGVSMFMISMTFSEYIYSSWPSEFLEDTYGEDIYPDFVTEDGEFFVATTYSETSVVIGRNITESEVGTYMSALDADGFNVSGTHASKHDTSSTLPYTYSIDVYPSGGMVQFMFSKSGPSQTNSLTSALSSLGHYEIAQAMQTALGHNITGMMYIDHSTSTIYIENGTPAMRDEIIGVCTFNEILNKYVFIPESYDSVLLLTLSFSDNYLLLEVSSMSKYEYSVFSNLVSLSQINTDIASWMNNHGIEAATTAFNMVTEGTIYTMEYDNVYVIANSLSEIDAIKDAYEQALEDRTNVQYSRYLQRYVCTTNNVAVSLNIYNVSSGIYVLNIYFSTDVSYFDYVNYTQMRTDAAVFEYFDSFPSLNMDSEPHFIYRDYSYSNYLALDIDNEFSAYYKPVLLTSGFTQIEENSFVKVDGNNYYQVTANYHNLTLHVELDYFHTMAEIEAEAGEYQRPFFDKFTLPTDTGAIFHNDGMDSTYGNIAFNPAVFDSDAYAALLVSNGYRKVDEYEYVKISSDELLRVDIYQNYLYFNSEDIDNLTYTQLVSELSSRGFETASLDNFVTISGMDGHYHFNGAQKHEFTVYIYNDEVTYSLYHDSLIAAGYDNYEGSNYYTKDGTTVNLQMEHGFLFIEYYDNRIFYKSITTVVNQLLNDSEFEDWRINDILLPTQSGNIYDLDYSGSSSFRIRIDNSVFDNQAYADYLIDQGLIAETYMPEKNHYQLRNEDNNIWYEISSNYIYIQHVKRPTLATTGYLSWLLERNVGYVSFSSDLETPSAWNDIELESGYVYEADNGCYVFNFYPYNPTSEYDVTDWNGMMLVQCIADDYYALRMYVWDFPNGESGNLSMAFERAYIDIEGTGYGFIYDTNVHYVNNGDATTYYYIENNVDTVFSQLLTFFTNNEAYYGPVELISENEFQVTGRTICLVVSSGGEGIIQFRY